MQQELSPPGGPDGINYRQIARMSVDTEGRLMWNGKLVQTQRRLSLSKWQVVGMTVVALSAASQSAQALLKLGFAQTSQVKVH